MRRNIGYMCRLGSSAFLCEVAIACMMFVGNQVFIHYLKEDGVAAFSIACYFFPIIFMVYNAIAQSAQPIISYNYGLQRTQRGTSRVFAWRLKTAIGCGTCFRTGHNILQYATLLLCSLTAAIRHTTLP